MSRRQRNDFLPSSQRRNLVFTAHGENIHVWVPRGSLQLLGSQAAMVIRPVMKEPSRPGYISERCPHAINNILVDDLGRDEVLVLATDSGNICAYQVEAIFSAVNRKAKNRVSRQFDTAEADPVSPFFVENVEQSAWGLAIHKFARLIAVSSNTCRITVFAFALVDSASTSDNDNDSIGSPDTMTIDQSDPTWLPIETEEQLQQLQGLMPHHHRSRNLRLTYHGHFDNIPSVSFANFDLDASGAWMVSTDINNKIIVWKIWEHLRPWESYYPGHSAHDPPEMGWTVIPLDPRTFKDCQSIEDACGCRPSPLIFANRVILDVSRSIDEVPDASQGLAPNENRTGPLHLLPDDLAALDCCIDPVHGHGQSMESHDGLMDLCRSDGDANGSNGSEESHSEHHTQSDAGSRKTKPKHHPLSLFQEDNEHHRVPPRLCDFFYEDSGDAIPPEDLQNMAIHRTSLNILKLTALRPTFFPVLHFSERHITLAPYPMNIDVDVLCRNVLFQEDSHPDAMITCDRFNLVKYVPELGLVVAASQKGRVAIISLTRNQEVGYAFRIDWILPFYTQEQKRVRPSCPFLGLAVSPMPGFEIPPDIPNIPRGVDPQDWAEFNYRIINPDDEESSSMDSGWDQTSASHATTQSEHDHFAHSSSSPSNPEKNPESSNSHAKSSSGNDRHDRTLPEIHAQASRAYRPHETWHGWHPSRRYRLLLFYFDHTVMSYEFWHDWKY
ncbi:hypothetical protein N7492_003408 [Penicillium capsulatum]|uniref:Uncharacterized protein n=1 Tax=Penicillium capsulatum TaxID=69766 RepID=A0A9W9ILA2_9EURO|nr:hypothetical protein N7492_003408 [Penicillium capsulatum]KAJ6122009.1 hypothetical protein N7512_004474 [Penicillium capsulatum]